MSAGRFEGLADEALGAAVTLVAVVAASVGWLLLMLQCVIVVLIALVLLPFIFAARLAGIDLPDFESMWRSGSE